MRHMRNLGSQDQPLVWTSSHPIQIGETVAVNRPCAATRSIEGQALARGRTPRRHVYLVQFIGDPVFREREVRLSDQPKSKTTTRGQKPSWPVLPCIVDFFPDEDL